MTIEKNLSAKLTKDFLSKLEDDLYVSDDEVLTNLKNLLYYGKTYEGLEIATLLEKNGVLPKEITTDIAYLHYIKMKNSHISQKILNDFISKYPQIKQKF